MEENLTALVVDDVESNRKTLSGILKKFLNLTIQTAEDGEEAYNKIQKQKPHILYTDVGMGGMTGDCLLERLVEDDTKIPTFVFSGELSTEKGIRAIFYSLCMYTPEQAEKLGFVIPSNIGEVSSIKELGSIFTVINKPYDLDDVISRAKKVLENLYPKQRIQS